MHRAMVSSRVILLGALVMICFLVLNAHAMPPKVRYIYDPLTMSVLQTPVPQKPAGMDEAAYPTAAVAGSRPCIVILLQFTDKAANTVAHPPSAYNNLLFSTGVVPTGSMKEYYQEVSYGQFTVTGQVTNWLTAPQTYAYYVNGNYGFGAYPRNAQRMALDACALADPTVNFALYDSDGPDGLPNSGDDDGYVDGLFIIHAGPGAEETGNVNDIWSHKWAIPGAYTTNDAKYGGGFIRCYTYSTEPEQTAAGSLITMGVFAHEYCHVLGMPDLYDYDNGYINVWDDNNNPLSDWCLMDSGSWGGPGGGGWGDGTVPSHPCAYIKTRLGWITPTVLTASQAGIQLQETETTNGAQSLYKVVIRDYGGGIKEYFYLENRNPNSSARFDKYETNGYSPRTQMDGGIVIYHVDERYTPNNNGPALPHYTVWAEDPGMMPLPSNPTQRTAAPYYELKGDAAYSLEDGQVDYNLNTGFPYHYLYPNSNANDGIPSGVAIRVLTASGPLMHFQLGIGNGAKVLAPPAQACDPGQSINLNFWVQNPGGYNETYNLAATSSHGWSLAYPATVGPIGPFGQAMVTVTLTVPSSHQWRTVDYITLRATSQANPSVWHQATTESPIATAISSFDAVAKRGGIELRSEFANEFEIRQVNIYRGVGDADPAYLRTIEGTPARTFSYVDLDVKPGMTYRYQLGIVNKDGEIRSQMAQVSVPAGTISLGKNYPNPFNPTTTITFTLPAAQLATLDVYDVQGSLVKRLFEGIGTMGENVKSWDGTNTGGQAVSSGVYYYRLASAKFSQTRKIVLLK